MSFPPESIEEIVDEFRRAHSGEPWFLSVDLSDEGHVVVKAKGAIPSLPESVSTPEGTYWPIRVTRVPDLRDAIERLEVIVDGDPITMEDRDVLRLILQCIRDADNAICWGTGCVAEAKWLDAAIAEDEEKWKLREKADKQWADGREAGIKALPYWKGVVDKILGRTV